MFETHKTTARLQASGLVIAAALCGFSAQAMAQDAKSSDIVVTAQRTNATHVENGGTAGVLGTKAAEDLPFNLRSFDETLILNQQPRSLGEVLQNDPTIRTTYGFGNASEAFVIRGFQLSGDDVGLNGLYGIAPRQLVAPELFGSVQVLNGASAFLNGAAPGGSGLGGAVNLLLKRAGPSDLNRVTFGYTSDSHFEGSFDVSRRFGDGNFGVRVNGAYGGGNVSIDDENRKTRVLGAAFDWESGPLRVSADIAYQHVIVDQLRGKVILEDLTSVPRVPKASANFAQAFTYTNLRDVFGTLDVEYDFAPNATLWAKGGFRDGSEKGLYSGINLTDSETGDGYNTPSYIPRTDNNEAAEVGARVKLGSQITHEIVVGANATWQVGRYAYDFRYTYDTNLYDTPVVSLPDSWFTGGNLDNPFPISRNRLWSVFASDTIGFWNDRILVTGGLRLQNMNVRGYLYSDGSLDSVYNQSAVTPVVGIVIKPTDGLSLYANRIEALQQGDTVPLNQDLSNAGQTLAPYKSTQYEIGGKVKLGPIFAGLALYQIKKPNGYSIDTDGDGIATYGYFGTQRNRGIEFTLNGEIVPGLRMISGFAINQARQLDTGSAATSHKDVKGVPDWTANANLEWDTPMVRGLTLVGRVTYTGKQWVDTENTLRIPDWAVFNLGARYVVAAGEVPVTLRFNVDNVANKRYWATAYDQFYASLLQGQPRTFKASISADF